MEVIQPTSTITSGSAESAPFRAQMGEVSGPLGRGSALQSRQDLAVEEAKRGVIGNPRRPVGWGP